LDKNYPLRLSAAILLFLCADLW